MSPPLMAFTSTPNETRALAASLAEVLVDGDLLVLAGDLGAGKTCFTQGLGVGLGVTSRITSPTFTLANEHQGRLPLHHLDVYRLDQIEDTLDLDLPELLEHGVTVIEWGEQILPALPDDRLVVRLLLGKDDDERRIELESFAGFDKRHTGLRAAIGPWIQSC
jgi:tRNA threonylcarbamoyladenosine biosynthesis protein TsaE